VNLLGQVLDWVGGGIVGLIVALIWESHSGRVTGWLEKWPGRLLVGSLGFVVGAAAVAVVTRGDDGSSDDTIEVLVVWEEKELDWFQRVVDEYPGAEVVVRSTGTDIGEDLDQRFADGDPPDVAIIPQPRLVEHYAQQGRIVPVDDALGDLVPPAWNELVTTSVDGAAPRPYGAWVKGSYKSLFWARTDLVQSVHPDEWVWTQLTEWVRDNIVDGPAEAPLTVSAKDCWPLTDWFENQLAAIDPELYDELAAGDMRVWDHDAVRQALSDLAALWSERRGPASALRGGPGGAAHTIWQQLPRQVADGEAALAFGPSFLAGQVGGLDNGDDLTYFGYPAVSGNPPPVVVGGDVAVIPRQPSGDEAKGSDLVDWLMDQVAIRRWTELDPGYLTPNAESPFLVDDPARSLDDESLRPFLTQLLRAPGGGLHFDLSDQFGAVNEGEPGGASEVFFDFFQDVTANPPVPGAVDRAIGRLESEARGQSQLDDDCG
jgi:alpha-glucoside transport system substrate-binding protein